MLLSELEYLTRAFSNGPERRHVHLMAPALERPAAIHFELVAVRAAFTGSMARDLGDVMATWPRAVQRVSLDGKHRGVAG
jgi:hypothetical protein